MGGAASGRKGSAYERELVRYFHAAGWGVLRLPSSGSATDRDLPDILAGHPVFHHYGGAIEGFVGHPDPPAVREDLPNDRIKSSLLAIELKSGKATTLYVDEQEVADLRAFADRWGATPYLGARLTTQATDTRHYLVRPEDARRTDAGTYGLPADGIEKRASVVVGGDGVVWRG